MDEVGLVRLIGDMLTELDAQLRSAELTADQADWQSVYAVRKNLDDQQRELVQADINADDVVFKAKAGLIETANKQLQTVLGDIKKIDSVINIVSQVSAALDAILKAA